jgi:hypothetical protein
MPKNAYLATPTVISNILYTDDEHTGLRVDCPAWFDWLEAGRTFYIAEPGVTLRCEPPRNGRYWYAYKHTGGKLQKCYAGRSEALTVDGQAAVAGRLA